VESMVAGDELISSVQSIKAGIQKRYWKLVSEQQKKEQGSQT
jgi:hypothetical protein